MKKTSERKGEVGGKRCFQPTELELERRELEAFRKTDSREQKKKGGQI